ncbi:MAG: helix-turn-helix transcriptional regulator [Xanthomonadales bacterium]|nr:helix-turn-helix transcriptional regulator [Xanthomonadales bacterium]
MNNRVILATNIKTLMKHADIHSQAHLSRVTGVSQTQVGNIFRHEKAASIDLLERLAHGLNCEPWLLLTPLKLKKESTHPDYLPLMYCYSRLSPSDQNTVWGLAFQLHETTNETYASKT